MDDDFLFFQHIAFVVKVSYQKGNMLIKESSIFYLPCQLWSKLFQCVFKCRHKLCVSLIEINKHFRENNILSITVQTQLGNSSQIAVKYGDSFCASLVPFLLTNFILTSRPLAQLGLKLKKFSRSASFVFSNLFAVAITIVQFWFTISPAVHNLWIYVWTLASKLPSFKGNPDYCVGKIVTLALVCFNA